jgi:hypothetical protein
VALARFAITAAAALLVGGCGGDHAPPPATGGAPATTAAPRPVAGSDLEREVADDFRQGLYRLAVMSQPPEGATDLGQSLPTGLVHSVDCSAGGPPPGGRAARPWRCEVRWRSVSGGARTTRYAVRVFPTGCFAAAADPALPPHHDATIASFAEHPLNSLVSVRKGC